jgi:hypothetical protein
LQTHVFQLLKPLKLKKLQHLLLLLLPLLLLMPKIRPNDLNLPTLQKKARASGLSFFSFVQKYLYL